MPEKIELSVSYNKTIGFVNVWWKGRVVATIQDRYIPYNILEDLDLLKAFVLEEYAVSIDYAVRTFVPAEEWGY